MISLFVVHAMRYREKYHNSRIVCRACFTLSIKSGVGKIESLMIEKRYVELLTAINQAQL